MIEKLGIDFTEFSLSNGTLNDRDLLLNYHNFLVDHYEGYANLEVYDDCELFVRFFELIGESSGNDHLIVVSKQSNDCLSYLMNELLPDLLNEIAPKECYFGSHPGNSSDLGFWFLESEIEINL